MAIIKKIDNIKFGKDVEDWNPHTFLVGKWNGGAALENSLEDPQKWHCTTTDEWINKMCCVCIPEHYLALKTKCWYML